VIDMDDFHQMVEDCEHRESRLTDWERGFIDSVAQQDRPPTQKQYDTLSDIWDRVTAKG